MDTIDFLSKLFWFLARPGNLLLLVLLIATLAAWFRPARGRGGGRLWLTLVTAVLLFLTFMPVTDWAARPLEERFPAPVAVPARVDGILVLGGIGQRQIADQRETLAVSEAAERLMAGAALARQYPAARLVIAGRDEDQPALLDWFARMGFERERIAFETESRNTFENALFSRRKLEPGPGEVWLLVTSARHMPRAVGVFRKLGWPVVPYPVDYQTTRLDAWTSWPDMAGNLAGLGTVLKEWVGLLAYYLMDRSDELWPAPDAH